MHLTFDIFQGIGIAAALGIRPYLGSLAAGLLAAGKVEIHFGHTSYSFLTSLPFLFVMAVFAVGVLIWEEGIFGSQLEKRTLSDALLAISGVILGALFFGANLCREGHPAWPGFVGGVICAAVGIAASRPFLLRLRSRLDVDAAAVGIPLLSEGSALLITVLSIVAPPVGIIALIGLVVLFLRGRGRGDAKYAGLRILR